jgi:L-aminopeptidase/D-esterase-like protein
MALSAQMPPIGRRLSSCPVTELGDNWSLPVAAETWDGYLNDINAHHVTEADCVAALDAARSGPLDEGAVGGGTGMVCYGFKGGSGTASRLVSHAGTSYTVGVFVHGGQRAVRGRRDDRLPWPPGPRTPPGPRRRRVPGGLINGVPAARQ